MSRFYVVTSDLGQMFNSNITITDTLGVDEPFDVQIDSTKNASLMNELAVSKKYGTSGMLDTGRFPIAIDDPKRLSIYGCPQFRLFMVEPVGEHLVFDGVLIADTIRVNAEVAPAMVFGDTRLYHRIMSMHDRTYGASGDDNNTMNDLCRSFDICTKLSKVESAKNFDPSMFAEDNSIAMQIFMHTVMAELEDKNPSIANIMSNAVSLLPIDILPYTYVTVYQYMTYHAENENMASPTVDELSDIVTDFAYDHFSGKL